MKKQYGFTLQELAVVLAILALMAIASTPKAQSCNRYPGNPDAPLWGMNLVQTWRESFQAYASRGKPQLP
ncbi:prepilin-type N-terminal cleavage/methylation domain-containing protein [Pseudomonas asiatica]|uniref:prepilin-type N-terminal cleavage/methylation domain-containing protein n=1 Tax=Pseudomonas asiatica TaxID=2219225 RepID=UPI0010C10F1E|nr:prepilin-type N-terminal cleavage/methylation domain-containing protein [Pseudomonas asiatica]EKT4529594.1 prepilin-type N-terminal cleavage/methylation domain-containing protein [Pseudomonas putida]